jgi:hypothetical protein
MWPEMTRDSFPKISREDGHELTLRMVDRLDFPRLLLSHKRLGEPRSSLSSFGGESLLVAEFD